MRSWMLIAALCLLIDAGTPAQEPGQKPAGNDAKPVAQASAGDSRATQLLRSYQTIRIETGTWLAKPEMCEGSLQKHREFEEWKLSIVRSGRADVVLTISHQPGWFYYQYSMVDTASQVVLASGNVTAWDGTVACSMVADAVVERTNKARKGPKHEADHKDMNKAQTGADSGSEPESADK